jgi:hypothetical protein
MNNLDNQRNSLPNSAQTDESKEGNAPTYRKQKSRQDTFMTDLMAGIDKNMERLFRSVKSQKEQGEA